MMLISRKDQKSFQSLPCLLIIHWFLLVLQYFPLKKKEKQNFQPNWPNEASLIYAYYIWAFKTKHLRIILKLSFAWCQLALCSEFIQHCLIFIYLVHCICWSTVEFPGCFLRYLDSFQCLQHICCSLNVFTQANPTRKKLSCLQWNLDKKYMQKR